MSSCNRLNSNSPPEESSGPRRCRRVSISDLPKLTRASTFEIETHYFKLHVKHLLKKAGRKSLKAAKKTLKALKSLLKHLVQFPFLPCVEFFILMDKLYGIIYGDDYDNNLHSPSPDDHNRQRQEEEEEEEGEEEQERPERPADVRREELSLDLEALLRDGHTVRIIYRENSDDHRAPAQGPADGTRRQGGRRPGPPEVVTREWVLELEHPPRRPDELNRDARTCQHKQRH
ncbi:hypothetical protein F4778DRAFT_795744 [Xylariomycetidae sp. FL2044]|nr:hypothetical protein F4778DRAFT_795744 [Xylariomycetidae sp. FL2044]